MDFGQPLSQQFIESEEVCLVIQKRWPFEFLYPDLANGNIEFPTGHCMLHTADLMGG